VHTFSSFSLSSSFSLFNERAREEREKSKIILTHCCFVLFVLVCVLIAVERSHKQTAMTKRTKERTEKRMEDMVLFGQ
jgi:hypothetical protein